MGLIHSRASKKNDRAQADLARAEAKLVREQVKQARRAPAVPELPAVSVDEILATPVQIPADARARVESFLDGELPRKALTFKEAMMVPDVRRERNAQVKLALQDEDAAPSVADVVSAPSVREAWRIGRERAAAKKAGQQ